MAQLSQNANKVQEVLKNYELDLEVIELAQSTRTALEAAQAIGCEVAQIVKSLVFRGEQSKMGLLILASGSNQVNQAEFSRLLGEQIERPNADFVRQVTGFPIGGVAPVGHPQPLPTYIDQDLFLYPEIWAAAGTPHAVFRLSPADLVKICHGQVIKIT